jgi:hypothetical protein
MTITSIGSSFSYIRPEAVGRETAAVTVQEETSAATSPGFGVPAAQATGSATPSVADQLRALLVRTQESSDGPSASEAARAYGGR